MPADHGSGDHGSGDGSGNEDMDSSGDEETNSRVFESSFGVPEYVLSKLGETTY